MTGYRVGRSTPWFSRDMARGGSARDRVLHALRVNCAHVSMLGSGAPPNGMCSSVGGRSALPNAIINESLAARPRRTSNVTG